MPPIIAFFRIREPSSNDDDKLVVPPHRHAAEHRSNCRKKSLNCLSNASFQTHDNYEKRRVPEGSSGTGVFFLVLLLDKQKKNACCKHPKLMETTRAALFKTQHFKTLPNLPPFNKK